ncbi:MAG: glycine/betaine ABC transporter substrate-binding protein [Erysipelotrichia bacterium]|nr:glycine/betaine ABC transporter substrate-binding protein [Erysipelotrichia bacterium]NCC53975.1 glycine/betaine ABC transporter substrate-binding protein [Erysipelotrichia bacterium]
MRKYKGFIASLVVVSALLSACTKERDKVIEMASKPMSEQYIISSMFQMLVEKNTDLKVNLTQGVGGGTSNIQPGMESKEFDVYPEYTGTGWNEVLKEKSLYTEDLFDQLQQKYQKLDMRWIGMIGFNNTFGIAVNEEIAKQYQLTNYSDLKEVADQLTFGAEYDFFEREDGYKALQDTYGLNFKKTMDLDIGLKYDAMKQNKIDVMNIFTTDGQLSQANIKVLNDDKHLYPSYQCGFIIRNEVLKDHPELKKVFVMFENLISDEEMAKMNYQVEMEKQDAEVVAKDFLKSKGLL